MRISDWSSDVCSSDLIFHYMNHAKDYGLVAEKISADIAAVVKRSRGVAKQLNQGVTHLMKKNKIAVHMGDGVLTGKGKLSVTDKDGKKTELSAKHIIVATGARARDLPFAKADGKRVWTYRAAMTPPEMPTRLRSEEHTSELQSLMRISYA